MAFEASTIELLIYEQQEITLWYRSFSIQLSLTSLVEIALVIFAMFCSSTIDSLLNAYDKENYQ